MGCGVLYFKPHLKRNKIDCIFRHNRLSASVAPRKSARLLIVWLRVQVPPEAMSLGQTLNDTNIPHGLVVRMLPFQGGGRGSIPRGGVRSWDDHIKASKLSELAAKSHSLLSRWSQVRVLSPTYVGVAQLVEQRMIMVH